ncbi:MAG TPA: ABC transporter substrate-binding protein [Stellaceae bacterium]|jgi:ABC-type nitrate/sulfonate/bicarbonate transport system substrate-binding protein|nr:ABC transporter substrate-binding protein [Stellaceae bacterium]
MLAIAAVVATAPAARAADQVHVGKAQGTAWTFLPVDIGIAQGFFAQEGLDVDSANLGGDAKVQQALAAGAIDFGLGSGPGLALAAKGKLATGIAEFAGPPRNISAIVLADSPIKSVADLKGKMIAVSTVGSLSDWLAKQMAIQEGWGQDGIKAVPLGAVEASIAALKAHQIDAVVLSTEAGFGLEERHEGRMLISMDHYAPHFITHVVFARRAMIDSNPQLVQRFLKGFFASIVYMKTHRAETSALAQQVLRQDATVVEKDYDFEGSMFTDDGSFDPQAVAVLKKSFVEMGILPSEPPDSALFTTQFVPVKP